MSPTKGTHYRHAPGHTRTAHRKTAALVRGRCQCNDSRCKVHQPSDICDCSATTLMYRRRHNDGTCIRCNTRYTTLSECKCGACASLRLVDETGVAVCDGCAEDMANSGLFADEHHLED